MPKTAARIEYTQSDSRRLYVALELGWTKWKLAMSTGLGQKPRLRTIAARDLGQLRAELARAKQRFGLAGDCAVLTCYEAGRDGFWLHRFLSSEGIENLVVDPGSIDRPSRRRRRKTDRLDAEKLVRLLLRYWEGEREVWSVVSVPSPEEEDQRHLHRELLTLKKERTRQINRMKGLLAGQGLRLDPMASGFAGELEAARLWDGSAVGEALRLRLQGEHERLCFIRDQVRELEIERRRLLQESTARPIDQVKTLLRLKGIGIESSWLFVMEVFAWREFRNRREAGSLIGLTPTPYNSGAMDTELGISKAGNRRVRALLIEIAWGWLRFQPQSKLTKWYRERFGDGGSRQRRIGIVAVARRLFVDLWRFVDQGIIPEGAILSPPHSAPVVSP
jgi:transposase